MEVRHKFPNKTRRQQSNFSYATNFSVHSKLTNAIFNVTRVTKIQGGPKSESAKFMAIILSNLNRFTFLL